MKAYFIYVLLFILLPATSIAQSDNSPTDRTIQEAMTKASQQMIAQQDIGDQQTEPSNIFSELQPKSQCENISDSTTTEKCWEAWRAYFNHYDVRLTHRENVFQWQHASSVIILFVVLFLVGAGLIFAAIQFRISMRENGKIDNTSSQLELSTSGIKINSSVLGVIILTLSLAFFYLYLIYVYPISELV